MPTAAASNTSRWVSLNACALLRNCLPELVRTLYQSNSDLLLTISNDTWSAALLVQRHLQIAQMRAAELGRPMLRATNNGITAIINAKGSIQQRVAPDIATVLHGKVTLTQGETWFSHFGHWRRC